ncbi:MAG: hypothetical protein ABI047_12015 [Jatrophihabitantaceae bacterium]
MRTKLASSVLTSLVLTSLPTSLVMLVAPATPVAAEHATVTAVKSTRVLVAKPAEVDFKSKRVGTENYKRTKITNTGPVAVRLLVSAGLPDDFGFGLLPGSTCPVRDEEATFGPGQSCYAVVRFSPTEFFIGWQAVGSLIATATVATEPADTAGVVDEISIPVLGMAVR